MRDPGAAAALGVAARATQTTTYRELAAEGLARIGHDPEILKARYDTEKKDQRAQCSGLRAVAADQDELLQRARLMLSTAVRPTRPRCTFLNSANSKASCRNCIAISKAPTRESAPGWLALLGDIGDPSSRPLIEELTKDKDSEVVAEAIAALRKLTPA